jgi:hypothetical protein
MVRPRENQLEGDLPHKNEYLLSFLWQKDFHLFPSLETKVVSTMS